MKNWARAFAALLALSAASCAQAPAPGEITPLLYAVRDRDSTMYLYGTVHVRPRGADWGNTRVRAAIDESPEIWTELIMSPRSTRKRKRWRCDWARRSRGGRCRAG